MRIVTAQELESWLSTGKVIEADARGPKVVELENGHFLKIFHTRRHPVLARLRPAAKRFKKNSVLLMRAGIITPETLELLWLDRSKGLSACIYEPLPGQSIEQTYNRSPDTISSLLPSLASFIRQLHKNGIYFRSLHLGNILKLPNDHYGLIDILDLYLKPHPLSKWLVHRNFQHLRRYLIRHKLHNFPLDDLLAHYRKLP